MKIGIYMGSFNPVHKGHIKVVHHLLDNKYLDKIIIVPTLNYWDKQNLAPIEDRINMLKFFETNKIIIDTKHNQYIYTYELYQKLKIEYPNDDLFLIIGADNLLNFKKWKNYDKLITLNFLILKRNEIKIDKIIKELGFKNYTIINDLDEINISSSMIRHKLNVVYLDTKVYNYIVDNNLYKGEENAQN